jgi:hypothetical protein
MREVNEQIRKEEGRIIELLGKHAVLALDTMTTIQENAIINLYKDKLIMLVDNPEQSGDSYILTTNGWDVWIYLTMIKEDPATRELLKGAINIKGKTMAYDMREEIVYNTINKVNKNTSIFELFYAYHDMVFVRLSEIAYNMLSTAYKYID